VNGTRSGRVAALIPAYRAERTLGPVLAGTLPVIPDVLVVDDGSPDATGEVARRLGARVVAHPVNRGKGAALRTGFDLLFGEGFDAVVTLDADGQHLPEEIPSLLRADADLVLGTREQQFRGMTTVRRTSNRWSSRAISILAGQPLGDIQTGFRLYSRPLIAATGFPEDGFEAESAVVVRARRLGFRIVSVPVRLGFVDGRPTSHYRPLTDSLRIAVAVVAARFERRDGHR